MTTSAELQITTGVVAGNNVDGEFWNSHQYDPEYEATARSIEVRGELEDLDPLEVQDQLEQLGQHWESSYLLFGSWKADTDGRYEPDEDDPLSEGFAAIYNSNYNTIQVVWSKYLLPSNRCSPCYPNQGDLDTPGDDYLCYALPPDLMAEHWLEEHRERYQENAA